MNWWTGVLSFLGGLLGAGIPALVALRRMRQDARSEWRQRLDQALALYLSDASDKRRIGAELLADLFDSDLGSRTDRALARRIARVRLLSSSAAAISGTDTAEE